jgi:hypothetical protein
MNSSDRIGRKISKLRHEGVPQREAVGKAMGMARANRITKTGGYRRVKKSRGRRSGRRYNRSRKGR